MDQGRLNDVPEVAYMHLLSDIRGRKVNHNALLHGGHDGCGAMHEDAADVVCKPSPLQLDVDESWACQPAQHRELFTGFTVEVRLLVWPKMRFTESPR